MLQVKTVLFFTEEHQAHVTRDTFFLKLYKIKAKRQPELFGREGHTEKQEEIRRNSQDTGKKHNFPLTEDVC